MLRPPIRYRRGRAQFRSTRYNVYTKRAEGSMRLLLWQMISEGCVGTERDLYYGAFFQNRDCDPFEIAVTRTGKRISKSLKFMCSE
jgi:hypothetical protein